MGSDHYDVLVIGSGPGGATTAARVAETGKRVLLLERGDFLPRERDNWDSQAVFGTGKYTADETFYDVRDRPFRPELHYFVGGNSKVYGAALIRLMPADFGAVQHSNGVAPAWPLRYDDMEPYYVEAEHLFWVHGKHGEDPFAGFSSQDYKYPPVQHEPHIQQQSDGMEKVGLHPFHMPLGVQLTQDAWGQATTDSPCIRCDRIDGFPCLLGAKADAEWAVIRPALAVHPNLSLLTKTTVERLVTDSSGRSVAGVEVTLPDGSPHAFTADIVVLSAGAILSAALLLKSATDKHPRGLGKRVMSQPRFRPISRAGPVQLPEESGGVTAFKFRDHDGHPLELIAFPKGRGPSEWRTPGTAAPFLGVDHTAIGSGDSGVSTRFFRSVFGFSIGPRSENRGREQAELDDVDDVHVSVTQLAPDLPAPRMELLHYHVGTRRPIPPNTASNDIAATHSVVHVASLDATADALERFGMPLPSHARMTLEGDIPAALVAGPDGHRFLVEQRAPRMRGPA
jgi:GMC oxidoreductase